MIKFTITIEEKKLEDIKSIFGQMAAYSSEYKGYRGEENPFFIYNDIIFYNLSSSRGYETSIESKFIYLKLKRYTAMSFYIKYNTKSYFIKVIHGYNKQFIKKCVFEWYRSIFNIPIVIFSLPKEMPESIKDLILELCGNLLEPKFVSDNGKEYKYKIPIIAFDEISGTIYSGYEYLASRLYDSFIWNRKKTANINKIYEIYHPKNQKKFLKQLTNILKIFDENKIEFNTNIRDTLTTIIFNIRSLILKRGSVHTTMIDNEKVLFIDLSNYAATEDEIILHELLHYTTVSVNFIKIIRECFNTLATYLLLPEPKFKEFIEKSLRSKEDSPKIIPFGSELYE
ncbi:MAG: hypothetical protein GF317_23185, partial [Candidatus Lokiarchaeota archaeon]|nr:hypothetical protein [Candidatus Lokiarchaeota archaeon]